jgi:hypothetical protein
MAEAKRPKKKKAAQRPRQERRFAPDAAHTSTLAFYAVLAGGALLGAGLYAQWIRDEPLAYAPYLLGAGAFALAFGLWFSEPGAGPIRVGDAGVAIEKGRELVRLPWCDMQRVSLERTNLLLKGADLTLSIPLGAHRVAVAWILSEGSRRVPDVMKAQRSDIQALPEVTDKQGELVAVEALQVAGRHCAASDKAISFERDARLCPTCAQVYHKDHVPKICVTCSAEVLGRTYSAAS